MEFRRNGTQPSARGPEANFSPPADRTPRRWLEKARDEEYRTAARDTMRTPEAQLE
jgi:hypothetical protein